VTTTEDGHLSGFYVLQPGVQHFLHPVEFRAPRFPHVVKARVHVTAKIVEPGMANQNPDQHGQCGYTHCQRCLDSGISRLISV
jgi:hypothetical protein